MSLHLFIRRLCETTKRSARKQITCVLSRSKQTAKIQWQRCHSNLTCNLTLAHCTITYATRTEFENMARRINRYDQSRICTYTQQPRQQALINVFTRARRTSARRRRTRSRPLTSTRCSRHLFLPLSLSLTHSLSLSLSAYGLLVSSLPPAISCNLIFLQAEVAHNDQSHFDLYLNHLELSVACTPMNYLKSTTITRHLKQGNFPPTISHRHHSLHGLSFPGSLCLYYVQLYPSGCLQLST